MINTKSYKKSKSFTFVELLIIILIISILAGIYLFNNSQLIENANIESFCASIDTARKVLEDYYYENERYPTLDEFNLILADPSYEYVAKVPVNPFNRTNLTFTNTYSVVKGLAVYIPSEDFKSYFIATYPDCETKKFDIIKTPTSFLQESGWYFVRASTAINIDGQEVAINIPRLASGLFGNSLLIEDYTVNLLSNPSFEDWSGNVPTDWYFFSSGNDSYFDVTPTNAIFHGNKSVRVQVKSTNSPYGGSIRTQKIPTVALYTGIERVDSYDNIGNYTYHASAYINNSATVYFLFRIFFTNSITVSQTYSASIISSPGSYWCYGSPYLYCDFGITEIPPSLTTRRVYFGFKIPTKLTSTSATLIIDTSKMPGLLIGGIQNANQWFEVDAVQFEPKKVLSTFYSQITGLNPSLLFTTSFETNSGTLAKPTAPNTASVISFGDYCYASNIANYTGTVIVSTATARTGNKSIAIVHNASSLGRIYFTCYPRINLSPGNAYFYEVYERSSTSLTYDPQIYSPSNPGFAMASVLNSVSDKNTFHTRHPQGYGRISSEWTRGLNFIVPTASNPAALTASNWYFRFTAATSTAGSASIIDNLIIYFDDVRLYNLGIGRAPEAALLDYKYPGGDVTIELIVNLYNDKKTNYNTNSVIYIPTNRGYINIYFQRNSARVTFNTYNSPSISVNTSSNTYYYIALSVTSTNNQTSYNFYVGALDSDLKKVFQSFTSSVGVSTSSVQLFRAFGGHMYNVMTGFFYDEIRVYNRALSEDEIKVSFNNFKNRILPPLYDGLVGRWSFDDTTGILGLP